MAQDRERSLFWGEGFKEHIELRQGSAKAPIENVKRFDSMDSLVFRVEINSHHFAFRPIGAQGGTRVAQATYAAFVLNRALCLDSVPQAQLVELWVDYKGQTLPWRGVLSRWIEGRRYNTSDYQHALARDAHEDSLASALTFEWWVNNTDVHHGNFYLDPDGHVVVIDHSLAFLPRVGPSTFFLGAAPPERVPIKLLDALFKTGPERLRTLLGRHVDEPTLVQLIKDRERLLEREAEQLELLQSFADQKDAFSAFEAAELEALEAQARSGEPQAFTRFCAALKRSRPKGKQAHASLELLAHINLYDPPQVLSDQITSILHRLEEPALIERIARAAPLDSVAEAAAKVLADQLLKQGTDAVEKLLSGKQPGHPRVAPVILEALTESLMKAGAFDAVVEHMGTFAAVATQELLLRLVKRLIALASPDSARKLLPAIDDDYEREMIEIRLVRKLAQLGQTETLYNIALEGQGFSPEAVEEAFALSRKR